MDTLSYPTGIHTRHSSGGIWSVLQQEQYQVYRIELVGHCYLVQAVDPDGKQVEIRVNPQTQTVFAWILFGKTPSHWRGN